MMRIVSCACRGRKRRCELRMIKGRSLCPFRGVNEQKFAAFRGRDPIPEAFIALPRRSNAGTKYERVSVVRHPLLGPRIIRGGESAWSVAALLGRYGKRNPED